MNTTHLTKEMILNRTNEVALMQHLVPTFDPNIRKNHKSIFSKKDNNPSMSIYWDGIVKKWKFKCHKTGYQGDVFAMWAHYYGLDCRTQFKDILETMAREMMLFDFLEKKDSNQYPIAPIRVVPQSFQADALLPSSITRNLQIQYIPFSKIGRLILSVPIANEEGKACSTDVTVSSTQATYIPMQTSRKNLEFGYLDTPAIR